MKILSLSIIIVIAVLTCILVIGLVVLNIVLIIRVCRRRNQQGKNRTAAMQTVPRPLDRRRQTRTLVNDAYDSSNRLYSCNGLSGIAKAGTISVKKPDAAQLDQTTDVEYNFNILVRGRRASNDASNIWNEYSHIGSCSASHSVYASTSSTTKNKIHEEINVYATTDMAKPDRRVPHDKGHDDSKLKKVEKSKKGKPKPTPRGGKKGISKPKPGANHMQTCESPEQSSVFESREEISTSDTMEIYENTGNPEANSFVPNKLTRKKRNTTLEQVYTPRDRKEENNISKPAMGSANHMESCESPELSSVLESTEEIGASETMEISENTWDPDANSFVQNKLTRKKGNTMVDQVYTHRDGKKGFRTNKSKPAMGSANYMQTCASPELGSVLESRDEFSSSDTVDIYENTGNLEANSFVQTELTREKRNTTVDQVHHRCALHAQDLQDLNAMFRYKNSWIEKRV